MRGFCVDVGWIFAGFLPCVSTLEGFRWILLEKGGFCLKKVLFEPKGEILVIFEGE